jgi:hypothetical protein
VGDFDTQIKHQTYLRTFHSFTVVRPSVTNKIRVRGTYVDLTVYQLPLSIAKSEISKDPRAVARWVAGYTSCLSKYNVLLGRFRWALEVLRYV